jgi:hypothetical protein
MARVSSVRPAPSEPGSVLNASLSASPSASSTVLEDPIPDATLNDSPSPPTARGEAETIAGEVFPVPSVLSALNDSTPPTPEAVKKKRGRPFDESKMQIEHLPKPPSFRMGIKPFFNYWRTTERKFPNRLTMYVYRRFPILDRDRVGKNRNIDKVVTCFGEDPVAEILHRYGSGSYRFDLTDCGINKKICECSANEKEDGLSDPDYPPNIELEDLVLEHPQNKSVIDNLRKRGARFPGDPGGNDDMGNEQATATMANALVEMATRRDREPEPAPAAVDAGSTAEVAHAIIEGMRDASKTASAMIDDAVRKTTEISKNQSNPIELVRAVVDLAKSMQPPMPVAGSDKGQDVVVQILQATLDATREELKTMRGVLETVQRDRVAALERALDTRNNGQQATAAGVGLVAARPIDDMEKMVTTYQKMKLLFGGGDDERDERPTKGASMMETFLPMILPIAGSILGGLNVLFHNMAVAKTGQGMPAPPPPPPQIPVEQPEMEGADPSNPQSQGVTPPQEGNVNRLSPMYFFLKKIERPLLEAVSRGDTGDAFAENMIAYEGRMAYDFLKEAGKNQIIAILHDYPPIWTVVSQVPQRFDQFLDQFFAYDDIVKAEEEREQAESGVGNGIPTPVVVVSPNAAPVKVRRVRVDPAPTSGISGMTSGVQDPSAS